MADIFAKMNCTYCQDEINGLRVQCCVCTDFDICLQCFASGAEIGPHKNDHAYKFVDTCAVSVFGGRGSWMGREEIRLLDAMELCGFGNWEFVSKHVETRTPEEVKEEFISRYLDGNIGKVTWAEVENNRPDLVDNTPEDRGPLSPTIMSRLPPLDITPEEARQLGYMTHRDDYEREYDTAAEQLVSSLSLNPIEDNTIEIALKLAQVDMYTRRLRERARRKRVVRDYQLVAKFFVNQRRDSKKPLTKEQREFRDSMRVFSQFHTSGEHERLIESIERERELRLRISELLRYRSVGLRTQDEAIHYEQHVTFKKQQQQRQSRAGSSGFETLPQEVPLKNGRRNESDQSSLDPKFIQLQYEEGENNYVSNNNQQDNGYNSFAITPINLLSSSEIQFCTSLNITPEQYIMLKTIITQDHLLCNGKIKTLDEESCDPFVRDAVTEYLSVSGWLPELSISNSGN